MYLKETPGLLKFRQFDGRIAISYDREYSEKLNKAYWVVENNFFYYLGERAEDRVVVIPAGYRTDGASVPRMFWSFIPPWGVHGNAAILHDYLCDFKTYLHQGEPVLMRTSEVDRVFLDAMRVSGVGLQRYVIYAAVRLADWLGMRD